MVPCASSQSIFDHPLDHNTQTSWKHIENKDGSLLHSTTSNGYFPTKQSKHHPCMNAESLSMCTEGLGFESFVDVERLKDEEEVVDDHDQCFHAVEKHEVSEISVGESKRSRVKGMEFPPPISSIGMSGKPWTCLQSYRSNGRFILKEVRIQTRELLHACREDGRLKLQFIHSDDEPLHEEDDDDDDDDEENDGDYASTRKPEIVVTSPETESSYGTRTF